MQPEFMPGAVYHVAILVAKMQHPLDGFVPDAVELSRRAT